MQYHPISGEIVLLLKNNSLWFETFEHEPVRTSKEASKIRHGYSIDQGAKAMIVKVYFQDKSDSNEKFVILVTSGSSRFDSKKVNAMLNAKKLRFANEVEVDKITGGVLPGGIPPFGSLFGLKTYADELLFENEKMIFNAGDRRFSIGMYSKDYKKIADPIICQIV